MRLPLLPVLVASCAAALGAQTVERPQPFDSAQRVVAVTPSLAQRLGLSSPRWPAHGDYREARLYSVEPGGGFVLVVEQPSGALERFVLSDAERSTLRSVIDSAMSVSGRPTAESAADITSEPAGNAFARRQTALAAVVYGPLAASLADDPAVGGALYLAVTGGTFFASYGAAQSMTFTRAQSTLAADLGLSSAADGWLLGYAASGNSDKPVRATALIAGVVGTIAGASLAERLSDAEAHAAYRGIQTAAATTLAAVSAVGLTNRATAASVALFTPVGYAIGVRYPRRATYTVTAGDVDAVGTSGFVGAVVGAAALGQVDHPSDRVIGGLLASGFVLGELVGDWALARPYDLTEAQANLLNIGAGAGALVGVAIPVLASSENGTFIGGAAATGAILGMSVIAGTFHSRQQSGPAGSPRRSSNRSGSDGFHLGFSPASLAGAFAGIPGNHVLARLTF
jgi:hypothetical protein